MKQLHSKREDRQRALRASTYDAWDCQASYILLRLLISWSFLSTSFSPRRLSRRAGVQPHHTQNSTQLYTAFVDTKSHPQSSLAFALSERVGPARGGGRVAVHTVRNFQPAFSLSLSLSHPVTSCFKVAFQITKGENRAMEVTQQPTYFTVF